MSLKIRLKPFETFCETNSFCDKPDIYGGVLKALQYVHIYRLTAFIIALHLFQFIFTLVFIMFTIGGGGGGGGGGGEFAMRTETVMLLYVFERFLQSFVHSFSFITRSIMFKMGFRTVFGCSYTLFCYLCVVVPLNQQLTSLVRCVTEAVKTLRAQHGGLLTTNEYQYKKN
ncbi:hypothetical protein GQX74_006203 [Glossina fuscipes]|nr:hypothetical protein GQX74_006203 [Glossina fuscipes]